MTPYDEYILQDVVATVARINPTAGFSVTISDVEREKVGQNTPKHLRAVVAAGQPALQSDSPLGHDDFRMPIGIRVWILQSETTDTPIAQTLYTVAADVRKTLGFDLHRGGYAIHTIFQDDRFEQDGAVYSAIVTVEVWFRTLRNQPYTV